MGPRGRRSLVLLVAAVLVTLAACGSSTVALPSASLVTNPGVDADVLVLGTLGTGDRLDGPPIAVTSSGSQRYQFNVTAEEGRLRLSLDMSNRDDCARIRLFDPAGAEVDPPPGDGPSVCPHDPDRPTPQVFDVEISEGARPGRWLADVEVTDGNLAARLRVLHDGPTTGDNRSLYPDLIPWLPWEFGFAAPASENPGTAHDRANRPGDPSVSCHPQEEPDDTQCLRFSAGVYNIGDGPMYIAFRDDAAYQHVYQADATPLDHSDNEATGHFEESGAGRGEWHPFHQHRHLGDFVLYELLEVTSPDGGMTELDTGRKHGYCTFSQQIADWASSAQDPQYASFPRSGPFCDAAMTLERGWGDIYRWQRPGQYLSYGGVAEPDRSMRAGRYVIRFTVDPLDNIAETNETNNVGYALVEVVDGGPPGQDSVIVCELGMGTDPWDAAKTVVADRFAWAKTARDPGSVTPTCP